MVPVDLSDRSATDVALKELTHRFSFDGVVNDVGFVRLARIGEVDLDELEYTT